VGTSRRALVFAVLAVILLDRFVPFGSYLLYPLTLATTWVHEMGHGLTALAVGGSFSHLEIFRNASGLAFTATQPGWRQGVVAAGGLMAPPLIGALTLALVRGPRRARIFLFLFAAALVVSLVIWVRSTAGWIAMPLVALLALSLAWKASDGQRLFAAQLLAAVLALDTLTRGLDYLFREKVIVGGEERYSDIAHVSMAFGGSYIVWGVLLAAASLALLAGGGYIALAQHKARA
jgi:hypothetical protein